MATDQKPSSVDFGRLYGFVRARQLEGTYPGKAHTGTWPITAWRVRWGWGLPPERAWPNDSSAWPPREPAGIDSLAHDHLGVRYQRVRSLEECKFVLASYSPVGVSIGITEGWYAPSNGKIPEWRPGLSAVSTHSVTVVGYNDSHRQLKFINSWGSDWGDKGFGYISYRTFERTWIEGWFSYFAGPTQTPTGPEPGLRERAWGAREFGGGLFHGREIVGPNEDRLAWTFAIQRPYSLDVEEFFVKPAHRGRGYGRSLARTIAKISFAAQQHPRIWISYPDATPENLLRIEKLFTPFGFELREAPVRWAPFVMCAPSEDLHPATLQFRRPRKREKGLRVRNTR